MRAAIANIYYLVFDLRGNVWRITRNFFENSVTKWWYSHYR